jgi:hypothetical protein
MALLPAIQHECTISETITQEHDDRVFRAVIENPLMSPVVASLNAITDMLRTERELFIGGEIQCMTK